MLSSTMRRVRISSSRMPLRRALIEFFSSAI
jgi:hypothetical protein